MKKFKLSVLFFLTALLFQSCVTSVDLASRATRKESHLSKSPRRSYPIKRNVVKWSYRNDGYAHCYLNGRVVSKSRCSHLPRPPKKVTRVVRWEYQNDGYAHCFVNGKAAKKSECSHLPRPPKKSVFS